MGTMAKEPKTVRIAIRVTKTEARMLDELTSQSGMATSDVIRRAIREQHAADVGELRDVVEVSPSGQKSTVGSVRIQTLRQRRARIPVVMETRGGETVAYKVKVKTVESPKPAVRREKKVPRKRQRKR
jgi:hypothetical protein